MSERTLTSTECLIIVAYISFLQSVNGKHTNSSVGEGGIDKFGPPREEKGSSSVESPNYTLEDLLAQIPADNPNGEKAKSTPFGPPRAEKGNYPLKHPNYTLKDLLDEVPEHSSHDEVDTGPPVGNEVW